MIRKHPLLAFTVLALLVGAAVIAALTLLGPTVGSPPFACTMQYVMLPGKVYDAQTGAPITGAYWKSERVALIGGEVIQELPEGWTDGEVTIPYIIGDDRLLSQGQETRVPVRVTVRKQGYRPIERDLTVITDRCHVARIEGDTDFYLEPE